jgi:hypothetical protein
MNFIDDLKLVNELPEGHLSFIINIFKSNPLNSFSLIAQYKQSCKDEGIDSDQADRFYKIISFVCDYCIEERSIEVGLREIETKFLKNYISEVSQIWSYIQKIIPELNEFILRRKERKLKRVTNNIDDFSIICDIRPVYDIKREEIISYLYPIILSIKSDSSESKINFEIDESELINIQKEVNTALSKLNTLKEKFNNV